MPATSESTSKEPPAEGEGDEEGVSWRETAPPLRDNVTSERFAPIERTFGTLPAAMRYFGRLPSSPLGAIRHLRRVKAFPMHLAEPA